MAKAREAAQGAERAEGEFSSDGRCGGRLVVKLFDTHKAQKDRIAICSMHEAWGLGCLFPMLTAANKYLKYIH